MRRNSQRVSIPRDQHRRCKASSDLASEVTYHHFYILYWLQASNKDKLRFKGKEIGLHFLMLRVARSYAKKKETKDGFCHLWKLWKVKMDMKRLVGLKRNTVKASMSDNLTYMIIIYTIKLYLFLKNFRLEVMTIICYWAHLLWWEKLCFY